MTSCCWSFSEIAVKGDKIREQNVQVTNNVGVKILSGYGNKDGTAQKVTFGAAGTIIIATENSEIQSHFNSIGYQRMDYDDKNSFIETVNCSYKYACRKLY